MRSDANGSVTAVSSAVLPDGGLQAQIVVPGPAQGIGRAAGAGAGAGVEVDGDAGVLDAPAVAPRDGTRHLITLSDIS
ncbi:hypothetical protein [Nonomuraea diastatica]|uniref:Uncharacterized protein n=1 Tax=Nonomuraea diastatica TaxID=1848329 RepID=A0A4R4W7V2_9ACTN|nr:hypothetical protein [Nonomuraea diastatica]TDD12183.1 hypothetical protein E1294_43955 [Nonomuraea diastatica]